MKLKHPYVLLHITNLLLTAYSFLRELFRGNEKLIVILLVHIGPLVMAFGSLYLYFFKERMYPTDENSPARGRVTEGDIEFLTRIYIPFMAYALIIGSVVLMGMVFVRGTIG